MSGLCRAFSFKQIASPHLLGSACTATAPLLTSPPRPFSPIHRFVRVTLLLRIEHPCRLHERGEQSSTKSKTGLSEKQFRPPEAHQRPPGRTTQTLTLRHQGAGCMRFELRSSSVHFEEVSAMALPPRVLFTLHEASARWGCNIADIAGWA
jgi:hypothetical protein